MSVTSAPSSRVRQSSPSNGHGLRIAVVDHGPARPHSTVPRLVAAGRSNQEIADELVVSPLTAKTHVARILAKMGARDRVHLVIAAYEAGLA